ncbi:uncharacterized protein BYT42DRAFT_571813 [Radiomyces spectabilis]|uniref:uncharacterized protein n=1 Tax=Radiomyces spectabilis TaxID=64574 RepID=UPI00221FAB00|nr:uncharacterized protein BYT42DRAFT_571813 [Radiomyces spectabilis]KAI8377820.1 hypothetical protein BYT42DRAFT_571813 [Radiomyces spectabilis]
MPVHSIQAPSKPRRFLNYLLSLIGFDSSNDEPTISSPRSSRSSLASVPGLTSSGSSMLSASTLWVSHDDGDVGKASGRGLYSDIWALETWITGLPKVALCHILSSTVMQFPELIQTIEDDGHFEGMIGPPSPHEVDLADELQCIKKRAHQIVHQLDHLRMSDQFKRASEVADEMHRLVRLCSNTLHAAPHGHSLFALAGLICIVAEAALAPVEVKQHLFCTTKFGRSVILEMGSVMKLFKGAPLASSQKKALLDVLNGDTDDESNWMNHLHHACAIMKHYDPHWDFANEYDQVSDIVSRYCS